MLNCKDAVSFDLTNELELFKMCRAKKADKYGTAKPGIGETPDVLSSGQAALTLEPPSAITSSKFRGAHPCGLPKDFAEVKLVGIPHLFSHHAN
mgnify:CR=1 FL=1